MIQIKRGLLFFRKTSLVFTIVLLLMTHQALSACSSKFAQGEITCALFDNQSIRCWGKNLEGQLGLGHTDDQGDEANEMGEYLNAVNLDGNVASLAASQLSVCVLLSTFEVKCWGYALNGQLGYEDTINRGDSANQMGEYLPFLNLGSGLQVKDLSPGANHICLTTFQDQSKCWGRNNAGQLGYGDALDRGDGPSEMGNYLPFLNVGSGLEVSSFALGESSTCAILSTPSSIKCWGYNMQGQLGQGDVNARGDGGNEMGNYLPPINLPTGFEVSSIHSGFNHFSAISTTGNLITWGNNDYGQLGKGNADIIGNDFSEMGD